MNEQTPVLPQFRDDGETLKPEALVDKNFTIVESFDVMRRDLTTGYKWIVRHADLTMGIYWAPGMAPPQQVKQWFRLYPDRELYATLRRNSLGHWILEQRMPAAEAPEPTANGRDRELDEQVPF